MRKEKIYIVGKVTGLPWDEVETKFHDAAQRLRELGFIVLNPIETVNSPHASWRRAMRICIAEIMLHADAVFLLPDWIDNSEGANIEVDLCHMLSIPVFNHEDSLLRAFGMYPQQMCEHPLSRQKTYTKSATATCETLHTVCTDCSAVLVEEIEC